jgi:hypothetical protein
MALRVEETTVVTIDKQTYAVDTLPENVRQLVAFYDDWKQRELELRSKLMAMQAGLKAMAQQIANAVQESIVAEAEVAEGVAANEPVEAEAANDGGDAPDA